MVFQASFLARFHSRGWPKVKAAQELPDEENVGAVDDLRAQVGY
jgi:hypothetical protein